MPVLHLREAEAFLPSDTSAKMEENIRIQYNRKKDPLRMPDDRGAQRRITKRTTSLLISDAIIIIMEVLQILALIQSMSFRWSWPETWLKTANFILLFNFDAWDFVKMQSGAYKQIQGVDTLSVKVPVNYNYILLAWGIFVFVTGGIFLIIIVLLKKRQPPYLMVHYANLERACFIMAQVFALPVGTVLFRLFHCTGNDQMAVFDNVKCFEGLYWGYAVPALLIIICLFGVAPAWMAYKIKSQKLTSTDLHHENYMKLKEVEYMAGLDVVWAVQGFSNFSSFRLSSAFYRPIVMMVKLVILIIFSSGYSAIYNQAVALSVILAFCSLIVLFVKPFRVMSFNVVLVLFLSCLCGNTSFGAMVAEVSPALIENPWLVEPYSLYILTGLNVVLGLVLISWIVYLVSRKHCCIACFPNDPLWPILASYGYEVNGTETYKFMAAILRGRSVLDSCMRACSVFAPVHQLARQIEIINAFCREAEKTRDGLHPTLLQLLDDMTDLYKRLEPVSLFAETVKENIRHNAARFVEMMPAFSQRLAQRDYDLILTDPVRKRLLLKMSIIGMFINSAKQKPVRANVTQHALIKIWEEAPDFVELNDELEYGEELYPQPITGPDAENMYLSGYKEPPLELMELDDSDEEESLAVFLGRVPPVLVMKDEQSRSVSHASLPGRSEEALPEMKLVDIPDFTVPNSELLVPTTQENTTHDQNEAETNKEQQITNDESSHEQESNTTVERKSPNNGVTNTAFVSDEVIEPTTVLPGTVNLEEEVVSRIKDNSEHGSQQGDTPIKESIA